MLRSVLIAAALVAQAGSVQAADYLERVESIYQAPGRSADDLMQRGAQCVAQHITPGPAYPAGHSVVSEYRVRLAALAWPVRSTVTFEAKDGRFRITHTAIAALLNGWQPVGKWFGSPWKATEAGLRDTSDEIAQCVQGAQSDASW